MIGTMELLIIFIVVIIGIAYLINYLINRNKTRGGEGQSALDIAKERYAKE
jgi:uncharacterized membrane protein